MKPEEAKDILSDMRDQHLCFLGDSEIKEEWQKKYLKEAQACDSGAKALAGLITGIKIDKGIIADSIQHYGKNNQSTVCMEECAELIQAISKAKRGKINRDNMIEEIADVLICIEMLKQMYMISDEKINKWIEKKQAREVKRISQNELLQLHRQSNCMDFNRCYCVYYNLLHSKRIVLVCILDSIYSLFILSKMTILRRKYENFKKAKIIKRRAHESI